MDILYHSTHITESCDKISALYNFSWVTLQNDWALTSPHSRLLKSAKLSLIIDTRVTTSNMNGILVYPF